MTYLKLLAALLVAFTLQVSSAFAVECVVADPADPRLNYRATPNGKKLGDIENGQRVEIQLWKPDSKKRLWGHATQWVNGQLMGLGWVIKSGVDCTVKPLDPVVWLEFFQMQNETAQSKAEAISIARFYAIKNSQVRIAIDNQGAFTIGVGVYSSKATATLAQLKAYNGIPVSSHIREGNVLHESIWQATDDGVVQAFSAALSASRRAEVARVTSQIRKNYTRTVLTREKRAAAERERQLRSAAVAVEEMQRRRAAAADAAALKEANAQAVEIAASKTDSASWSDCKIVDMSIYQLGVFRKPRAAEREGTPLSNGTRIIIGKTETNYQGLLRGLMIQRRDFGPLKLDDLGWISMGKVECLSDADGSNESFQPRTCKVTTIVDRGSLYDAPDGTKSGFGISNGTRVTISRVVVNADKRPLAFISERSDGQSNGGNDWMYMSDLDCTDKAVKQRRKETTVESAVGGPTLTLSSTETTKIERETISQSELFNKTNPCNLGDPNCDPKRHILCIHYTGRDAVTNSNTGRTHLKCASDELQYKDGLWDFIDGGRISTIRACKKVFSDFGDLPTGFGTFSRIKGFASEDAFVGDDPRGLCVQECLRRGGSNANLSCQSR